MPRCVIANSGNDPCRFSKPYFVAAAPFAERPVSKVGRIVKPPLAVPSLRYGASRDYPPAFAIRRG